MNGSRSKFLKNEFRKWFRVKFGMEPAKMDFRKMMKTFQNTIQKDFYQRPVNLVQTTKYGEEEINENKGKKNTA